jgi:hypothetical protein
MKNQATVQPNWEPLKKRVGRARCVGFMYMGRVNGINLYKHGISRSYLNLDDEGGCYIPRGAGCYVYADFDLELAKLEACLGTLQATLETPYDEIFIARKRELLRQQGVSLLTIEVEPEEVLVH